MDDNRSEYRTQQGRRDVLEVVLLQDDGPPVRGEILDLCYAGAGISFALDAAPRLRSGDDVRLEFLVCGTGRRVVCKAVVQHLREDALGCRYGFHFLDSRDLHEHLDSGLLRLFNRRRKVRVRPCAAETVAVELDHDEAAIQGALLNISETGLSVRLPVGAGDQLPGARTVGLALALPGQAAPMRLTAVLRYRALEATSERWGLEFEDPAAEGLEAVRAYVGERLREITENRPHAA